MVTYRFALIKLKTYVQLFHMRTTNVVVAAKCHMTLFSLTPSLQRLDRWIRTPFLSDCNVREEVERRKPRSNSINENLEMPKDLYYMATSGPCCAVILIAAALDVEVNLIKLNIMEKANLTPEFLEVSRFQRLQHRLISINFLIYVARRLSVGD